MSEGHITGKKRKRDPLNDKMEESQPEKKKIKYAWKFEDREKSIKKEEQESKTKLENVRTKIRPIEEKISKLQTELKPFLEEEKIFQRKIWDLEECYLDLVGEDNKIKDFLNGKYKKIIIKEDTDDDLFPENLYTIEKLDLIIDASARGVVKGYKGRESKPELYDDSPDEHYRITCKEFELNKEYVSEGGCQKFYDCCAFEFLPSKYNDDLKENIIDTEYDHHDPGEMKFDMRCKVDDLWIVRRK